MAIALCWHGSSPVNVSSYSWKFVSHDCKAVLPHIASIAFAGRSPIILGNFSLSQYFYGAYAMSHSLSELQCDLFISRLMFPLLFFFLRWSFPVRLLCMLLEYKIQTHFAYHADIKRYLLINILFQRCKIFQWMSSLSGRFEFDTYTWSFRAQSRWLPAFQYGFFQSFWCMWTEDHNKS